MDAGADIHGPRGAWCESWLVALNGGPPLVSGYCGSHFAADRPKFGRFLALLVVSGAGPRRAVGVPPGKGSYAAASSSAGLALSMMICSTSLGVYPHVTSWFR